MLTGELRNKIDRIWDVFSSGGISNPLTVIEQITYLLFIKRLDEIHTVREQKAHHTRKDIEEPIFKKGQDYLRWSRFRDMEPDEMFQNFIRNDKKKPGVFQFVKELNGNAGNSYAAYIKDAVFMIPTPQLLHRVVDMLDDIPMESRDMKGDIYEYLLSHLTTAGRNGQFRTPRHIILMMVSLIDPKPDDIICDPACGTAGFLVSAGEYLRDKHPEIFRKDSLRDHFMNEMFCGIDFDATMLRISVMNLLQHGVENPRISGKDSLSETNAAMREMCTVILANPPFKGSLDYDSVSNDLLKVAKTKKTELLFISLFLNLLKTGGRCACIVPDGVLFGSSNAHKEVRKSIINEQKLDAVISMPSGVFKPYAGVSTAVLLFTKTNSGGTDNVWFYDMQADGYSLDDKRTQLDPDKHEDNNIPDIVARWYNLKAEKTRKRTDQSFLVPADEIRENGYDLSINRYKEIVHEEIQYDPPKKIIADIRKIEEGIQLGLEELEGLLG